MSLRRRVDTLQHEAEAYFNVLHLPSGEKIRYTTDDALAALNAAVKGEHHWFIDIAVQADTREGLCGMIWAITASRKRVAEEEEGARTDDG